MAGAAGVDVAAIVDSALELIREGGTDAVTMRALADRLGVRAPSLYHHVRGRDELLLLAARRVFATRPSFRNAWDDVRSIDDWNVVTMRQSDAARRVYRDYRGLATRVWTASGSESDLGGHEVRAGEVDALVRLGLTSVDAESLSKLQSMWTLGFVVAEEHGTRDPRDVDDLWHDGLRILASGLADRIRALIA